jgi:hypothetical protein
MGSWLGKAIKLLVKFGPMIYQGAKITLGIIKEYRVVRTLEYKIKAINRSAKKPRKPP